jgi:hypothetical protein
MDKFTEEILPRAIALGILTVFTAFAFFMPQECGIDAEFLWCRLHPMGIADVIGLSLFYLGTLHLAGVTHLLGIEKLNLPEAVSKGLVPVLVAAAGAVIFWNF